MKKYLIIIAIILLAFNKMYSQNFTENSLVGNWKVNSIEILNITEDLGDSNKLEILKKIFLKAKFEFKSNKRMNFKFEMKEMEINNQLWKFNSVKNLVTVTELEDNESILMELEVSIENSKTYFNILETPFKLEVSKE